MLEDGQILRLCMRIESQPYAFRAAEEHRLRADYLRARAAPRLARRGAQREETPA